MVEFGLVPPAVGGVGAPTNIVATAGTNQVSVAFTAPDSVDGVTVTNYAYSTDGGSTWVTRSPAATTSPLVITGLTGGTEYSVALRAIASELASTPVSSVPVSIATVSGTPTVSGTATAGSVLTASASGVTVGGYPTPTTAWQWQRSANGTTGWADISAATASTYTIQEADRTNYLRATYTATNSVGSASASSAATTQVPAAHLLQDDFTKADGALAVATTGQTWTPVSGTWEVRSNKARSLTHTGANFGIGENGGTGLSADVGAANIDLTATANSAGTFTMIVCAGTSALASGVLIQANDTIALISRRTGATTQTQIGDMGTFTGCTPSATAKMRVVVGSNNILHIYYSSNGGSTWVESNLTWDVSAARAGSWFGWVNWASDINNASTALDAILVDPPA